LPGDPRFSSGKLPRDYTPMSSKTMANGDAFGPIEFTISPESHARHLSFLQASGTPMNRVNRWQRILLPFFEVWPLARVVSRARFGRVNEVVALGASTVIHRMAREGVPITATASLSRLLSRRGLAIGRFVCRAEDEEGRLLTETTDHLLLLHDSDPIAVRQAIEQADGHDDAACAGYQWDENHPLHLTFRHHWNPAEWINNIHVPSYARSVGYRDALAEGAGVMDVVFSTLSPPPTESDLPISVAFNFRLPLYAGLDVRLKSARANKSRHHWVLVSQEASNKSSVLLEAKVLHRGG